MNRPPPASPASAPAPISTPFIFFSAPHRVMFLAGITQVLLTIAFWTLDLGARYAGLYEPFAAVRAWPVATVWLHALTAIFGFFPFFIFGFLMTALPRWIGAPPLSRHEYLPPFWLMGIGWLGFYAGLLLIGPSVAPVLALVAVGWFYGACMIVRVTSRQRLAERAHAWAACATLFIGIAALLLLVAGIVRVEMGWIRTGIEMGVWGYLLPMFFIVSHRMLPFFSGAVIKNYPVWRPLPVLWLMLICFAGHFVLAVSGLHAGLWLVDGAASLLAFLCLVKWRFWQSFTMPLLAMLHVGTFWLAIGLALFAVQGLSAAGWAGFVPLHALTAGYLGSLLLAMATRVTLGHSGLPINSSRIAWPLFWVFQGVVLLRLAGGFYSAVTPWNPVFLAAIGWLLVFGVWGWSHARLYVKPRADGQPG